MTDILTEQPWWGEVTIYHGETFYEPIPQLVDNTDTAVNLTGKTLQLFMRPTFDYEDPIEILTSVNSAGILIDNAADGLFSFFLEESDVTPIPVGEWEQFLRISWTDGALGAVSKHLWRGPLIVRPGNTAA